MPRVLEITSKARLRSPCTESTHNASFFLCWANRNGIPLLISQLGMTVHLYWVNLECKNPLRWANLEWHLYSLYVPLMPSQLVKQLTLCWIWNDQNLNMVFYPFKKLKKLNPTVWVLLQLAHTNIRKKYFSCHKRVRRGEKNTISMYDVIKRFLCYSIVNNVT